MNQEDWESKVWKFWEYTDDLDEVRNENFSQVSRIICINERLYSNPTGDLYHRNVSNRINENTDK